MQDDIVMGTLTVRENLTFSANLRLPVSLTESEKLQKVSEAIQDLGLTECADSVVGWFTDSKACTFRCANAVQLKTNISSNDFN